MLASFLPTRPPPESPTYVGSRTPAGRGATTTLASSSCEELGLTITQAPKIGWSSTDLAPGTAVECVEEIEALVSTIAALRNADGAAPAGPTGGGRSWGVAVVAVRVGRYADLANDLADDLAGKHGLVLACECSPAHQIRASAAVTERALIVCGVCSAEFVDSLAA